MCLIQNDICAVNAHTNLDCAPGGVNDILADTLSLTHVEVIEPKGTDPEGKPYGLLRRGYVKPTSLDEFLNQVKAKLGAPMLRFVRGGKPVHKVAVGGGACASEMQQAINAGCDTFVTSDAKYNQFWDAKDMGLNLIDAGHFYTENPAISQLASTIAQAFPNVTVKISRSHRDCMEFA